MPVGLSNTVVTGFVESVSRYAINFLLFVGPGVSRVMYRMSFSPSSPRLEFVLFLYLRFTDCQLERIDEGHHRHSIHQPSGVDG
jgi:hypothetical protein